MCHPHLLLAAVSVAAASMVISGGVEGGEVKALSRGPVLGHTAGTHYIYIKEVGTLSIQILYFWASSILIQRAH